MKLSKIGKALWIVTAVLAIIPISLFALYFRYLGSAAARDDAGGLFGYIIPFAVAAVAFCIVSVAVSLKVGSDNKKGRGWDELVRYENLYGKNGLDTRARGIMRKVRAFDLVTSFVISCSLVIAFDYVAFFADFRFESVGSDVAKLLAVIIPLAVTAGIFTMARECFSEKNSVDALVVLGKRMRMEKPKKPVIDITVSRDFIRFKNRLLLARIIKSAMVAVSVGGGLFGIGLILIKQCVIDFDLLYCIILSASVATLSFVAVFLLTKKSDMVIAEELDTRYALKARIKTMLEYSSADGDMIAMQRDNANTTLSGIKAKLYGFNKIWVYAIALVLCAVIPVVGFITEDLRGYVPPEEEIPFKLSALQEARLTELIAEAYDSEMEQEFKTPIADELKALLEKLRVIDTYNEMQIAMVESMSLICDITYDSSTSTEMLNALWDTEEIYLKHLAKALDTSTWNGDGWADFAESVDAYIITLMGDNEEGADAVKGKDRVRSAVSAMMLKVSVALKESGLAEDDEMYVAVNSIFNHNLVGLSLLKNKAANMSDDQVRDSLIQTFDILSEQVYSALKLNWKNASTGEYVMTRLGALFSVPVPEFERPDFVKNNESVGGGADGNKDEGNSGGGGIGKGETFGSDDIVLDPKTGTYRKYGEIINEYSNIMNEKLNSDSYTDEQKEMIKKYFALLYSGIKKEGN